MLGGRRVKRGLSCLRRLLSAGLAQFGKEAAPPLIEALKSPAAPVRVQTARALGQVGTPAKESVPSLVAALQDKKDDDAQVRQYAQQALQRLQPKK